MGAHASTDTDAFKKLHERARELTVADMYKASRGDIPLVDWTLTNLVTSDVTVEALLQKLSVAPGGACVVVDRPVPAKRPPIAEPPVQEPVVQQPALPAGVPAGAVQVLPIMLSPRGKDTPAEPTFLPPALPPVPDAVSTDAPAAAPAVPPPSLAAPGVPPPTLATPAVAAAGPASPRPAPPTISPAAVTVAGEGPQLVDCVDLFTVVRYVLLLYEGSYNVHKERVEYWSLFDTWIEERIKYERSPASLFASLVPSADARSVLGAAAATFFSASVKEMLATPGIHQFSRTTFPNQAISSESTLEQALPLWCSGYLNLLVKTPKSEYLFVSQQDVLNTLFAGVLRTNLQGAGSIPIKKLGLIRKVLYSVQPEHRALQAFRMMSAQGIQSVPVVSDHKHLRGEVSLLQLHALQASNFSCLLSTVHNYLGMLGPAWNVPPLTVHRQATVGEVIRLMHVDSLKRTHVWVVSGDNDHVKGMVSVHDILSALQAHFIHGGE